MCGLPIVKNRLRECGVLTQRIPRSNNLSRVKNTEPWDKTIVPNRNTCCVKTTFIC